MSEYPHNIYEDIAHELLKMESNNPNIIKKKLKYLESLVINKIYSSNKAEIPNIFCNVTEKQVCLEQIIAISNMSRVLKNNELT